MKRFQSIAAIFGVAVALVFSTKFFLIFPQKYYNFLNTLPTATECRIIIEPYSSKPRWEITDISHKEAILTQMKGLEYGGCNGNDFGIEDGEAWSIMISWPGSTRYFLIHKYNPSKTGFQYCEYYLTAKDVSTIVNIIESLEPI